MRVLYCKYVNPDKDDKGCIIPGTGGMSDFVNKGTIVHWGISYEELTSGIAQFTIAIVKQDEDSRLIEVPVHHLKEMPL